MLLVSIFSHSRHQCINMLTLIYGQQVCKAHSDMLSTSTSHHMNIQNSSLYFILTLFRNNKFNCYKTTPTLNAFCIATPNLIFALLKRGNLLHPFLVHDIFEDLPGTSKISYSE